MCVSDPLAGWWLDPGDLKQACDIVQTKKDRPFKADTLVLSRDDFHRLMNACLIHPYGPWIRNEYLKMGINCVIIDDEQPYRTFNVSSGLLTDGSHIRDDRSVTKLEFVDLDVDVQPNGILPAVRGIRLTIVE